MTTFFLLTHISPKQFHVEEFSGEEQLPGPRVFLTDETLPNGDVFEWLTNRYELTEPQTGILQEHVLAEKSMQPMYAPRRPVTLIIPNPGSLTEVAQQRGMTVQAVRDHHAQLVQQGKARFEGKRFISLDAAGNDTEPVIIDDSVREL